MATLATQTARVSPPPARKVDESEQQSDAELLSEFQSRRNEAAFAELMLRHGPMVFHLCRRLLPALQDAEDVYQATFLSLARQAGTIRKKQSVVSWLYGVARHLALNARLQNQRRAARERKSVPPANRSSELQEAWRELQAALDEELHRLPEKHQLPLVLCYLEGMTHEQAARHLGWPVGTVCGRVARAREELRSRLDRRGLALPASALATVLAANTLSAAIRPACVQLTLHLCLGGAGTDAAFAHGGIKTLFGGMSAMTLNHAAFGLFGLLTAAAVVAGSVCLASVYGPEPLAGFQVNGTPPASAHPTKLAGDKPRFDAYGDPLPSGAVARIGTHRLWYGESGMGSLAYSSDAKRLATIQDGRTICIFDLEKGSELARIGEEAASPDPQLPRSVSFVTFSNDDSMLATVESSRWIRIWDVKSGKSIKELAVDEAHGIFQCAFSPDGQIIAAASYDGSDMQHRVHLWDVKTGKAMVPLVGHSKAIQRLAFTQDGKRIATASDDNTLRLWDVAKAKELVKFEGHDKPIVHVAISPDGKRLGSSSLDSTFRIWNTADGKELAQWKNPYVGGAISPHGHFLAFVDNGKGLCIGNGEGLEVQGVEKGEELRRISNGPGGYIASLSPDGKTFAVASRVKRVRLFSAEDGKEKPIVTDLVDGITAFAFSPDGKFTATAAGDGTIRLSSTADGKTVRDIKEFLGAVLSLQFLPDGKHLLAVGTGGVENEAMTFEIESGKRTNRVELSNAKIVSVCLSEDGKRAVARTVNKVYAFDMVEGKVLHEANITGWLSAISADGTRIAFPAYDLKLKQHVVLWDLAGKKEIARLHGLSEDPPDTAAFTSDGLYLVTRTFKGEFRVWDASNGKFVRTIRVAKAEERPLVASQTRPAISRDGRMMAIPWNRKGVRLVEVATGGERATVIGDQAGIQFLGFAADHSRFASCSQDCTVLLWDMGRVAADPTPARAKLNEKELRDAWEALGGDDSKAAFTAIRRLSQAPDDAVKFLAGHLKADPGVEAKVLDRLVANLESEDLKVRKRAEEELERLGARASAALTRVLENQPSLEFAERVRTLLAKIEDLQYSLAVVRDLRAIETLEGIGTPEAVQVLKEVAKGSSDSPITQDAQRALKRLAKR